MLDTPPDAALDELTQLAARIFQVPIALVSLLDEQRQWFKSRVGVAVAQTPRALAFCDHAMRESGVTVVADARNDPRFRDNPLVHGQAGMRFYAGAPLRTPEGHALGTLCVIDREPRQFTEHECAALAVLSRRPIVERFRPHPCRFRPTGRSPLIPPPPQAVSPALLPPTECAPTSSAACC